MHNDQFRVMHIISNLDIGGAQEVVRTLVAYLAEEGCVPIVCTFKDGPLRQDIERLGPHMVANLAAIRIPRAADYIHDSEAVALAGGREDIHQEADAIRLGIHHVLFLDVRRFLPRRSGRQ